jgi:phage-related tail fiber protein
LKGINMSRKTLVRFGAGASLLAMAAASQAAAIDVTGLVTDIGAQAVPVGLVGVAVLLVFGAVKAFKWVRAALS